MLYAAGFAAAFAMALAAILYARHVKNAVLTVIRAHEIPRCSCEKQVKTLQDALADTNDALMGLANRVKMQRVRTATNHVGEKSDAVPGETIKDMLRRKAGLVAGQPAKHS